MKKAKSLEFRKILSYSVFSLAGINSPALVGDEKYVRVTCTNGKWTHQEDQKPDCLTASLDSIIDEETNTLVNEIIGKYIFSCKKHLCRLIKVGKCSNIFGCLKDKQRLTTRRST